jgi:beta-mannosidase
MFSVVALLGGMQAGAQAGPVTLSGWQMQDAAKVDAGPALLSSSAYRPDHWYAATVPGTVLTTLVDNKVYPEPLYGENMRQIPESLNKTSYWYRAQFDMPRLSRKERDRHTWLHFAGINYSAEIWVNGHQAGTMRGAFIRGDFDVTPLIKPGTRATLAVLIHPQPHPGQPHEHTVAGGVGKNGGETALDGPTFLSTIGWDWLPAVRDRDTGIWLPVTLDSTGPVVIKDPFITSDLAPSHQAADLQVATRLTNLEARPVDGVLVGTVSGHGPDRVFRIPVSLAANESKSVTADGQRLPELHLDQPALWWPNGYGPQNLYQLSLRFEVGSNSSDQQAASFGVRKIEYQVADSENLTISVNGVRIMVRGGNWGLDEGMKRVTRERLDAQFRMHQIANLNMIRNWVGQSTSPEFYEMADKYGILLWDEFFQPNPFDGPDVEDIPTYLANVTDKVKRYRNHPSIAVWCARNEGYPPRQLDEQLKALMSTLDPSRLYQSNSADGRGVSSHGPYFWRSPRYFYDFDESFKTEVGSVSVPTLESIQGMMPEKDWETIDDDWAQHDMARGAQRGDEYPANIAARYGHIRNLADFVRKAQLANYEAFRAMYEGRNAKMFETTSGILTWMSHPAQPSFVWQLYHYDLEPNAALFAVEKASERVHVQLNEVSHRLEIVNNQPAPLTGLHVEATLYNLAGVLVSRTTYPVASVPPSRTVAVAFLDVPNSISAVYFTKLDLMDAGGNLLSTNFYWQNVAQDDFRPLEQLPAVSLKVTAELQGNADRTSLAVTLHNGTTSIALMTHLQLHAKSSGKRILPAFYSDNYLSLVPGETRTVTIECASRLLAGDTPLVEIDGFNVDVAPSDGPVSIAPNLNAQPMHSPASQLLP